MASMASDVDATEVFLRIGLLISLSSAGILGRSGSCGSSLGALFLLAMIVYIQIM